MERGMTFGRLLNKGIPHVGPAAVENQCADMVLTGEDTGAGRAGKIADNSNIILIKALLLQEIHRSSQIGAGIPQGHAFA